MAQQNNDWAGAVEVSSNWFKFEKVGDAIKGTLLSKKDQPSSDPNFPDQLVCELKTAEGDVWNVGVSVKKQGTVARLRKCKVGEVIGIKFESEGEPAKKGFHPVKNLKIYSFGMDPNYNEMDGGEEVVEPEM